MREKLQEVKKELVNFQFPLINVQSAFTLIELLIVIGIIGILSTLLMANFVNVRERARDSQRKADLRQIQSALELYRTDNGGYKVASGQLGANCPVSSNLASGTITYMQKIPCEPNGTSYYNNGNYYYSSTDGTTYTLAACLENKGDTDSNDTNTSPGGSGCTTGLYFVLTNP